MIDMLGKRYYNNGTTRLALNNNGNVNNICNVKGPQFLL